MTEAQFSGNDIVNRVGTVINKPRSRTDRSCEELTISNLSWYDAPPKGAPQYILQDAMSRQPEIRVPSIERKG
jgi:hypothetical protein